MYVSKQIQKAVERVNSSLGLVEKRTFYFIISSVLWASKEYQGTGRIPKSAFSGGGGTKKKKRQSGGTINILPNDGLIGAIDDIMILCEYRDLNSN